MPIYTPNNLKIRLQPEAVQNVLKPLMGHHSMEDIFLDVETWEAMPTAISIVLASAFAPFVAQWWEIIWIGLASYVLLHIVRGLTYIDVVRRLTMVLGTLPITILVGVGVPAYLAFWQGEYLIAIALFAFNLVASFQAIEVLMLLLPLGLLRARFGHAPTSQEAVFVAVCNRRARKSGVVLDWDQYSVCETQFEGMQDRDEASNKNLNRHVGADRQNFSRRGTGRAESTGATLDTKSRDDLVGVFPWVTWSATDTENTKQLVITVFDKAPDALDSNEAGFLLEMLEAGRKGDGGFFMIVAKSIAEGLEQSGAVSMDPGDHDAYDRKRLPEIAKDIGLSQEVIEELGWNWPNRQ